MQNKPNLLYAQMNVSAVKTMNYEQITMNNANKNKPNFTRRSLPVLRLVRRSFSEDGSFSEGGSEGGQTQPVVSVSNRFHTRHFSKLFLFFTFLCSSYNLAMQSWTIQKLLNWVIGYLTDKAVDSPRLSAELLLCDVLNLKRIELYTNFDKPVTQQQLDRLHGLVKRAGQYEPIDYLLGKTEFYSLKLKVSPDCMIPRPETELLVDKALEFLRARSGKQFVCDLCTGSGCIAAAIAQNFDNTEIIATDISSAALNIAAENIAAHNLKGRIELLCGDLFDPIETKLGEYKFDLIVCNPPYVSAAEFEKLGKNVKDYEPRLALFAGDDGLDIYRRIIEKIEQFLKPGAALVLEIGYNQGQAVRQLLEPRRVGGYFSEITIEKDFHGNDRIIIAQCVL